MLSSCSVFSYADAQPMGMKHADAQPIRVHATDVRDILSGMACFLPSLKFSKSEKRFLNNRYLCIYV
jgi:hypothetical protein